MYTSNTIVYRQCKTVFVKIVSNDLTKPKPCWTYSYGPYMKRLLTHRRSARGPIFKKKLIGKSQTVVENLYNLVECGPVTVRFGRFSQKPTETARPRHVFRVRSISVRHKVQIDIRFEPGKCLPSILKQIIIHNLI